MGAAKCSNINICPLTESHKRWSKLLNEYGILYLYAMTGFGKTAQAKLFAQAHYKEHIYFSASQDDFCSALQETIASRSKFRVKTLLILDDLQWAFDESRRQFLFDSLVQLHRSRNIHVMLLSRAALPSYLVPLQLTRQLTVEDQSSLRLDLSNIRELMESYTVLARLPASRKEQIEKFCLTKSYGYPIGVSAIFLRFGQNIDDYDTAFALATQDIYDYLDIHLLGEWTQSRRDAAVHLSVFQEFDLKMAALMLGDQVDAILKDFSETGSFLIFKAPDTYYFIPFFKRYLESILSKRPRSEWLSLYEIAATCYEKNRDYEQALHCWNHAGRDDKIAELVIYLSENAEGCSFARIAQEYISNLPPELEQRDPRILGAKVMLAAYRMQPEECLFQMERLKQMADNERKCVTRSSALAVYVRTSIACPYDTAEQLKDNIFRFADYVRQNGFVLNNIMPTGNMPSLINGGLDLLSWEKNKKLLYPVIKTSAELIMGREAVGIADGSMGEILYEQNQKTKAMAYLTKALSAANYNGSIRVQYAVTAIMARLFHSEGQYETADTILNNVRSKAIQEHFSELLPNINASFTQCALLRQDMLACEDWMKKDAPDEYQPFYITMRYQLLIKARVYTAMGKTMEAMYILNLLESFSVLYKRIYFRIEVLVLKAIILFRREEKWQETLFEAINAAIPYGLVRVFADQGAALLPLWKQLDWGTDGVPAASATIFREMKRMSTLYPNYLKPPHRYGELSAKEREVIELMADGCNNGQIGALLGISLGTVKFHVANIMKKLEADNRTVAVKIAQEEGLL